MCNGVYCVIKVSSIVPSHGIKQKYSCETELVQPRDSQVHQNKIKSERRELYDYRKKNLDKYSMNTQCLYMTAY